MDPSRLRYFLLVAQTGSVRRAAELARVSPSALSRAVKALEGQWGVALFTPSGRGIAITDAGRALQQRAARLVAELESFEADVRGRRVAEELLRLGSFEVFSTHFLGWAIHRFVPNRPVLIRELVPGEIERALVAGEIDIGLTNLPVPRDGVDFLKVARHPLGIYGRPERFAGVPFEQLPFCAPVSRVSGSAIGVQGLDGWPLNAPGRRIRYQTEMLGTALELCSRGDAVLFIPRFVAALHNERTQPALQLLSLPLPSGMKPAQMDLYLAKRTSTEEARDFKLLARAVRECCRELA